jgi:hypothetical protein
VLHDASHLTLIRLQCIGIVSLIVRHSLLIDSFCDLCNRVHLLCYRVHSFMSLVQYSFEVEEILGRWLPVESEQRMQWIQQQGMSSNCGQLGGKILLPLPS